MFHCSIKSVQHSLHPNFCGQLGNTRMWPLTLRSIGRQLRDAPSDWRRSSFAFPGWRRFRILSCHSRPDRRGPNPKHYTPALASSVFSTLRRETLPYGWGDHEQRGPHRQLFPLANSSVVARTHPIRFATKQFCAIGLDPFPERTPTRQAEPNTAAALVKVLVALDRQSRTTTCARNTGTYANQEARTKSSPLHISGIWDRRLPSVNRMTQAQPRRVREREPRSGLKA